MAINSFSDIIGLWPSPREFADRIGAKYGSVRAWKARNSIPAHWWKTIVEAAETDRRRVTYEVLAALAERGRGHD